MNAVHNGQKDHKCDSCGKAFSLAGVLKRHINAVHNGQKDHECEKEYDLRNSDKLLQNNSML